MGSFKRKKPGRQRRGLMAPAGADACNPGSGWHVYNGQALGFTMGRRWVDWVYISPELTVHEAHQALGKAAYHLAFLDAGQYQEPAEGWRITQHVFRGSADWFVLTVAKKKCAYMGTSRDFFRAFGIRMIGAVP
jgi:hypothetical protein